MKLTVAPTAVMLVFSGFLYRTWGCKDLAENSLKPVTGNSSLNPNSKADGMFKTLVRLVAETPQVHLLVTAVCLTVLLAFLEIYYADITRKAVDWAIAGEMNGLSRQFFLILAVVVVQASSRVARKRLLGKYVEGGLAHLRDKLAAHLAFSPLEMLEERHSGDYVSRETNDLARVEKFFRATLLSIVYRPLTAAGAVLYCLDTDWKLTVISMAVTPLTVALASRVSRPMSHYGRLVQEKLADLNGKSQDLIHGIEVARVFGLNQVLEEKFGKSVEESVRNAKNMAKVSARLLAISIEIGMLPFLLCFGAGGFLVLRGELSPGSLLAFIMLLNHLTAPFSEFPGLLGELRSGMTAAKRVLEVFDLPSENSSSSREIVPSETGSHPGERLTNGEKVTAIRFKSVSFCYPGRNDCVLRNANLDIKTGEKVAIVGPSGSGKSTLIKLLMGFYRNYQGEIFLLGKPLQAWDLEDLRRNLALVTQDTYLFPGSIRDNISMGKIGCSFDEVVAAARVSHIHEFIVGLPQGYDTDVGELGGRFSGGEKQRIAIARAVVKDAPILLLDEATSSLDTEVERSILESLSEFLEGRTAIMVTHRPSILRYVDKAFLLDAGALVECLHPEEVLREGVFSGMTQDIKARSGDGSRDSRDLKEMREGMDIGF